MHKPIDRQAMKKLTKKENVNYTEINNFLNFQIGCYFQKHQANGIL